MNTKLFVYGDNFRCTGITDDSLERIVILQAGRVFIPLNGKEFLTAGKDRQIFMRRYSLKRQKVNRVYDREAKRFREENYWCGIRSPHCTGRTQGVHHVKGRGIYLLDKSTWKPACNACNSYIESNDKWARENGFKKSRLNKV